MRRRVLKIHDRIENHMGSSAVCILVGAVHEEASQLRQAEVTGSLGILIWSGAATGTGF